MKAGLYNINNATVGPGSRSHASTWIDARGNYWLFGGLGIRAPFTLGLNTITQHKRAHASRKHTHDTPLPTRSPTQPLAIHKRAHITCDPQDALHTQFTARTRMTRIAHAYCKELWSLHKLLLQPRTHHATTNPQHTHDIHTQVQV